MTERPTGPTSRPRYHRGVVTRRPIPFAWFALSLAAVGALVVGLRFLGTAPAVHPEGTPSAKAAGEIPAPPECRYGDRPTPLRHPRHWSRTLLDTHFALPPSYEPPDLVSTRTAGFEEDEPIREIVIDDLSALRSAAERAGNPVEVTWGYRSYATQRWVFRYWSERKGRRKTLLTAARPGHSEHQLGTALDFRTKGAANVDDTWTSEPAGRWMARNAWRFGFVMSYPRGSEDVTCYSYEPWHYRYFGRARAAEIHESGLTPREYLWSERFSRRA